MLECNVGRAVRALAPKARTARPTGGFPEDGTVLCITMSAEHGKDRQVGGINALPVVPAALACVRMCATIVKLTTYGCHIGLTGFQRSC